MTDTSDMAIDRTEAEPAAAVSRVLDSDADKMRRELQSVIASPDFARAPIMKRLLSFLVGETAAGRGDQLKAYSVAVDGLGRAPDYDARADSYPRVQVGRLRRMLDSYYNVTPPVDGLRLTIPSGRYRVALQPANTVAEAGAPADISIPMLPGSPLTFGWHVALLLMLVLLIAAVLFRMVPMRTTTPDAAQERPVLEFASADVARESQLGNVVRAALLNGLSRSGVYDLRSQRRSGIRDPHVAPPRYRLSTDMIGGANPRLFLRLSRVSPDQLLWSGDISLPSESQIDGVELDRRLAPVIASIGRVNGLVATHELQESNGLEARGYSCFLLYHRYRKDRTDSERDHVRACVEASLKRHPEDPGLQAAAAQLAIERTVASDIDPRDRAEQLQAARRHAQIATAIAPQDPWALAARARIAVIRKACPQAVGFAMRASEVQPYDPALLADIGVYLLDCGDPRAEEMIRRAIALDDNPEGRFYAPLLLLAISRDDKAMAHEALAHMAPPVIGRHSRFYLISAAGYAMLGDYGRARAAWIQLKANSPLVANDPEAYLEQLGYAADLRGRAMAHLRKARLAGF
ncbi:hypothetical protein ASE00_06820 [Sphingomonas sp. Root710]|uniref:tetratricopeptide repeat protein n=1 Tax=Sphingomonas sp. Root710 TaxID=1736594 RepID=UPI0006FC7356|nr:tetratricopeptide repeat protein [Sphingomonas sp. Root710]KRB86415.1 hypothetical protein ASE00_06820 [Sphingomonas sp. Root710]